MPVVRIWKRGGSEEPPRKPATTQETKRAADTAKAPAAPDESGRQPATQQQPDGESTGDEENAEPEEPMVETKTDAAQWDLEVRPLRSIRNARITAVVLAAIFIFGGIVLRHGSTGVNFRISDQIGLIIFGLLLGGSALLFTRPRVRVGPRGVEVRNVVGESFYEWKDIRGISFADKKSWPRLELVYDEYAPVMAIRTNDKVRAVEAMNRFRELGAEYTGETAD
ncbi:PH domain-containing protein [Nocardia sp. NPDC020380]|uniref:PH domain-containing protein n=1 Tax=Nocardia sp. NPDC020380 TaxID=3364309 RepID=UPI0037BE016C